MWESPSGLGDGAWRKGGAGRLDIACRIFLYLLGVCELPRGVRTGMAERIGDLLLKAGLISDQQLGEALQLQKTNGGKLGYNLVKLGHVKEEDITSLLSEQYGVPAIHLEHFEIDESILKHIPSDVAQKYLLIPIERTGATLTVAMADPSNVFALDDVRFITGLPGGARGGGGGLHPGGHRAVLRLLPRHPAQGGHGRVHQAGGGRPRGGGGGGGRSPRRTWRRPATTPRW